MADIRYELATEADDAELRRLLRQNPFPGALSLSFECEPSFFNAAALEGPFHQTMIGRDAATGIIRGMGSRAVREMYVNGEPRPVGYMSLLRADQREQWGLALARLIAQGFSFYRTLHADGRAPYYLLSVVADNQPARRFLTARLREMPHLREYTRLFTYTIAPARSHMQPRLPAGYHWERGTPARMPAMLACLRRYGQRHQFAPCWTEANLFAQTPGLAPENFFLVLRGDHIVGCVALWDQTRFKQTVVRGYSGAVATWRPLINVVAPWLGYPALPSVGTSLRYGFASHLAMDDDEAAVFIALLQLVSAEARAQGLAYFMLGLGEAHPLRPVLVRRYRHLVYVGQIYLVAWEDGFPALAELDARPPALEIAIM